MESIMDRISNYQREGLFLNPHDFPLPTEIKEALEDVSNDYSFAIVFEDDCIYEIPIGDPYSYRIYTGEAGYTEFLKGWAGALEGAYEAYLDGEYFEHQEEMAIRHERYSELLTKFIEKLK